MTTDKQKREKKNPEMSKLLRLFKPNNWKIRIWIFFFLLWLKSKRQK